MPAWTSAASSERPSRAAAFPSRGARAALFLACLLPLARLFLLGWQDALGANPVEFVTRSTGTWTLVMLCATLSVTPLRRLGGWNGLVRLRRMLGLFAFFYGCLHLLTYVVLDQFFAFDEIVKDVAKRPFITAGATGLLLMIPLAITSTAGWIRRLGGRRWQHLHRLAYVVAVAGVVHYYWLVKADTSRPVRYGLVLAVLLAVRLWFARTAGVGARRSRPAPAELAR